MPDAYDKTLREIFPDAHAGSFSQLADGRWVWTTFNSFQWDLNCSNPAVFTAMAGEMLAIANIGAEFLRMDAVAFVRKQLGTMCENLPEAHGLIRAFSALVRFAATGDCRISGTCASLAGVEQGDALAVQRILLLHSVILSSGGIPLIYLGDEVGTLNDLSYQDDVSKTDDSRWVHRSERVKPLYDYRHDQSTVAGQIYAGFQHMIAQRSACDAFAGVHLTGFRTGNPSVLGYQRGTNDIKVLILANFSEFE